VFAREIILVLPLKISERILWLVEHKYFTSMTSFSFELLCYDSLNRFRIGAMYLCKRNDRRKELIEVANQYALHLWEIEHNAEKVLFPFFLIRCVMTFYFSFS